MDGMIFKVAKLGNTLRCDDVIRVLRDYWILGNNSCLFDESLGNHQAIKRVTVKPGEFFGRFNVFDFDRQNIKIAFLNSGLKFKRGH